MVHDMTIHRNARLDSDGSVRYHTKRRTIVINRHCETSLYSMAEKAFGFNFHFKP